MGRCIEQCYAFERLCLQLKTTLSLFGLVKQFQRNYITLTNIAIFYNFVSIKAKTKVRRLKLRMVFDVPILSCEIFVLVATAGMAVNIVMTCVWWVWNIIIHYSFVDCPVANLRSGQNWPIGYVSCSTRTTPGLILTIRQKLQEHISQF